MNIRGIEISMNEEAEAFEYLCDFLGREPTDEEIEEYIDWQIQRSEDHYYNSLESDTKFD
jgi:hypothetical protein